MFHCLTNIATRYTIFKQHFADEEHEVGRLNHLIKVTYLYYSMFVYNGLNRKVILNFSTRREMSVWEI